MNTITDTKENKQGKTLRGTVVKTAMRETATVEVSRYVMHPKYKKYRTLSKKFLAHNAGDAAHVGDAVVIREGRPISKRKRFTIVERTPAPQAE